MLKIGDKSPSFKGVTTNGEIISLADFKDKKIVIYFYPKDSTPGCTAQACNLRDNYQMLLENGYSVIGVSSDNENSHQRFTKKFSLPFPLIADVEKKIIMDFGVWGKKKFMGKKYNGIIRTTFIISEDGLIEDVITKVKTKDHTSQIILK